MHLMTDVKPYLIVFVNSFCRQKLKCSSSIVNMWLSDIMYYTKKIAARFFMLGVNRIAVDQRIGFKGSDKPKKD